MRNPQCAHDIITTPLPRRLHTSPTSTQVEPQLTPNPRITDQSHRTTTGVYRNKVESLEAWKAFSPSPRSWLPSSAQPPLWTKQSVSTTVSGPDTDGIFVRKKGKPDFGCTRRPSKSSVVALGRPVLIALCWFCTSSPGVCPRLSFRYRDHVDILQLTIALVFGSPRVEARIRHS